MPLAVSQDNSVATVKPRGKSPYTTRAGGICSKIGAPYVSQRVFFFFIIVFRDMNTRTLKHTHRKRRRGEENLKPKRLRVQESPRFAHQTGFTDESPLSVTVTHRHTHTHKHPHTHPSVCLFCSSCSISPPHTRDPSCHCSHCHASVPEELPALPDCHTHINTYT